jgi:predicted Fe-Mo cluster-binding NifX family protein
MKRAWSFFIRREASKMALKVAIASNDRQSINEHFGRARHFLIFEWAEGHFKLVEVREIVSPHCGGSQHDGNAINTIVDLLSDCRFVLASQIGPGAIELLGLKSIKGFSISGVIDQALAKLAELPEVKKSKNQEVL